MFVIFELQITRNSQRVSKSVWRMADLQWNKFLKVFEQMGEVFTS
jgi:hypothetical protein